MRVQWIVGGVMFGLAAVIAVVVLTSSRGTAPASAPAVASVCDAEPKTANLDFRVKNMQGQDVDLLTYKGKVLLVDFWATWCAPCKAEIPGFVALYDKYREKGFEVVGMLSLDEVEKVPAFAAEFKMNYPILNGNERPDIEAAFGPIEGLPTSVLIGRDGRVCSVHLGFSPVEKFERQLLSLL